MNVYNLKMIRDEGISHAQKMSWIHKTFSDLLSGFSVEEGNNKEMNSNKNSNLITLFKGHYWSPH